MKILTVRQPWAGAIIHRGKDVENRTRNLAGSYRGPLAIHVGLRHDYSAVDAHNAIAGHIDEHSVYGYGAIIGVVDLVDVHVGSEFSDEWCIDADSLSMISRCSQWGENATHHLVLRRPRPLAEPIPYKGALGMRTLPDDVEQLIMAGVAA